MERDIIAERVKAGLRRAKENGKKLGRPKVDVNPDTISTLKSQGLSLRAIASQLGISHTKVAQVLAQDPSRERLH